MIGPSRCTLRVAVVPIGPHAAPACCTRDGSDPLHVDLSYVVPRIIGVPARGGPVVRSIIAFLWRRPSRSCRRKRGSIILTSSKGFAERTTRWVPEGLARRSSTGAPRQPCYQPPGGYRLREKKRGGLFGGAPPRTEVMPEYPATVRE